jgi:DNA mismatch repair protein MutL
MTKKIIELDQNTINQIAAGEVVENPASVVKELVENAIDANATKISVEVVDGGFTLIKIIDDGDGFDPDDMKICLKRHTTSKLKTIDDLWKIGSMGFRGEALASIASIAELSIISKSKERLFEPFGYELKNLPTQQVSKAPIEKGTIIEIKGLFYNVPARKAFQKSAAQSLTDILKTMTKIALAFPHLEMEFSSNSKTLFYHQGKKRESFLEELKSAVDETLDPLFLKGAFSIDDEEEGFSLRGYLGSFHQTRTNRLGQHLFINKRPVISPLISQVIKNAYGTRIDSTMHPTFVLHLHLPFDAVDVNVHPQKKEVRIRDEKEVLEKIKKATIAALLQSKFSAQLENEPFSTPSFDPFEKVQTKSFNFFDVEPPKSFTSYRDFQSQHYPSLNTYLTDQQNIRIIGSIFHYVIVESEELQFLDLEILEPVTLINSKALREKLHYEKIKKQISCDKPPMALQTLLFPILVEFDLEIANKIEKNSEMIEKLGIQLNQIGKKAFNVIAVQEGICEDDVKDYIDIIIKGLENFDQEEGKVRLLKALTKKKLISKEKMAEAELKLALKDLLHYEDRKFSFDGEKLFHPITLSQIEKVLK